MSSATLDDVLTDANLFAAWSKVRENGGSSGVDGETIEAFEENLMANLDTLRREVRFETYRPRPLLRVMVEKEEGSGRLRALSIPAVRDRILQTAVALVLTPVFEAEFEEISFAYRKGRSVDQAIARVERLRDQGFHWVVDADIRAYFDNIDHARLMREVKRLVKDPAILDLIHQWITSKVRDGKRLYRLKKGVPQGSPISPLLSNLYLDRLDDELLDENLRLVRFADDFVILCKSRKKAQDALELTSEILETLKLEINERKTRIVDFNRGFRFLGVQFIRSLAFKTKYRGAVYDFPSREESRDLPQNVVEDDTEPTEMALAFARALAEQQHQKDDRKEAKTATRPPRDRSDAPAREEDMAPPPQPPATAEQRPVSSHDPRLRTLYLLRHGCVLGKRYERLVVYLDGQVIQEIPAIKVDQVMVFGNASITTPAMQFCLGEKIPIVLLSGSGRYHGVIDSFDTDPVLLHRDQFLRAADPQFRLSVAREIIRGKLANSRLLLMRYARKRDLPELGASATRIKRHIDQLDSVTSLDELRGHEGSAAKSYFGALGELLAPRWNFSGRNKRPPTDPVNAMLSYGYTLLFYNVYALLRARGLNPHVGCLHPMRAGHPALASDMVEEFRALIVDTVVLNLLLNRGGLSASDFTLPDSPGAPCLLDPAARKKFIRALENKFNAAITHPGTGYRIDYRRCIETQIQLYAAVVRGREDAYRAMVLR